MININSLSDSPDWLVEELVALQSGVANTNAIHTSGAPLSFLSEGSRNTILTSEAGSLRRKHGLNEEDLFRTINAINLAGPNPLQEEEVRGIARSVAKYPAGDFIDLQDIPLSRDIAASIEPLGRNVPGLGWTVWTGKCWRTDGGDSRITEMVKRQLEAIYEGVRASGDPERVRNARSLLTAGRVKAIKGLIDSEDCLRAEVADFDVAKDLINLANGTYDFQTKALRRHDPNDLLTKVANLNFEPAATSPNFDKLLQASLPKHHQSFVLRLLAYAMLGNPVEQIVVIFVGRGANGKSTLVNAVAHALGGYSVNVEPTSFIKQKGEKVRNDIARLRSSRFVVTSELATGDILDAPLVKRLAGNDNVAARELYKEYIEFLAKFVVFMITNALPVIDGADEALARRIVLVPFKTIVPEHGRDSDLPEKLRAEASGIFNRLLEGLEDYKEIGLAVPEDLKVEAARYIASSDMIARFIEDEYDIEPNGKVKALELFTAYRIWCGSQGLKSIENGGEKVGHGSGGMSPLRAA